MPDACWKATERAISRRFGTTRIGPLGREGPDAITDWLCIEVKERDGLPLWIESALKQIKAQTPAGKLAIVVAHNKGKNHDNDIVMLTLKDFQEWFGNLLSQEKEKP